jgi:hypothetical protein
MIDVTDDIENGTLTINENSYHLLNFVLSNRGGKYTGVFTPNDRIVVQMKRVNWLQNFSGYLDSVPYFTTYNKSVSLSAECTMKRIRFHWWDPGYQQTLNFLASALTNQTTTPDAGMSKVIQNMLTGIIGWDAGEIHIGSIPSSWLAKIVPLWSDVEAQLSQAYTSLGGLVVAGATGTGQGTIIPPDLNGNAPPSGVELPQTSGTVGTYNASGQWDSAINWGYLAFASNDATDINAAQAYLQGPDDTGQRLLVANNQTGVTICVATTTDKPPANATTAISLGSSAMSALGFSGTTGEVSLAWAPVGTDLGAYKAKAPTSSSVAGQSGIPTASTAGLNTGSNGQLLQGNWYPAGSANPLSTELTGLKTLMNDTAIMPTFASIVQSGLRSFCAAPNGDFIAWFPDYFGVYGTAAVWNLETIEMHDFQINWTDQNLITHEFTAGSYAGTALNTSTDPANAGASVQGVNMIQSYGVATIDVPGLFQALFNVGEGDTGIFGVNATNNIYQQFGPRPNFDQMATVAHGEVEFWYAVYKWQQSWAQQFNTNLQLTFMPELWPGMLLQIQEFGFQAYIKSVTHTFDLNEGGGFDTSVTIIAPSATDGSGLLGLARSGVGVA